MHLGSGADPGFFKEGGCKFEGQGNGGGWRVERVRVMFEYVDFLHFGFREI